MRPNILSVLVAWVLQLTATAQTPLAPTWVHTWPFGSDMEWVPSMSAYDDHVAVDPATGLVYATVDDQEQLQSPHCELLHTFAADGADLTPVPVPLLGQYPLPISSWIANAERLNDFVVYDGVVYQARELQFETAVSTGSIAARRSDGSSWTCGLGNSNTNFETLKMASVLADEQGVIYTRDLSAAANGLHAFTHDGWPQWSKTYPGMPRTQDAVFVNGEIIVGGSMWMTRIERTTGAQIATYQIYSTGQFDVPMQLATDGTRIFALHGNYAGDWTLDCLNLDGSSNWSVTQSLGQGATSTELVVDPSGRPWFTVNRHDPLGVPIQPVLVITATDGSSQQLFTYGATMQDIAMDADQAYITGRLDTTSTTTYLIAVGMDMTTTVEEPLMESPVRLFPQPASTAISIANTSRISNVRVMDATGKQVQAPQLNATTLDVSRLSEGIYFMQAVTAQGPITKRFAISR
ncbi:MAG: T9SS type A sorting domain-containing protein [Flavobacteriales bacterium]